MRFIDAVFNTQVSGTVVAYQPRLTKKYIGSPSLCVLSDTVMLLSHDFFGPQSQEYSRPETRMYRSVDGGESWHKISSIQNSFWSRLFYHNNVVYLLGTDAHYGNLVIRRSLDQGITWSNPTNSQNGLIKQGDFHCAPTPVVTHNNHLHLALEFADGPNPEWGKRFGASIFSVSADADLLDASQWTHVEPLYYDPSLLGGDFGGWLEGNAVLGPDNTIYNVLRVENDETYQEMAAVLQVNQHAQQFMFDAQADFVSLPGGSKKFSIRCDPVSGLYITLSNTIDPSVLNSEQNLEPDAIRNQVSLVVSKDLRNWSVASVVLYGKSVTKTAFQYISWDIIGGDIVFASRTAYYDMFGGAKSYHDANYLTFHRIHNFRQYFD